MAEVVLTGFEPFGGWDANPSWAAVQLATQRLRQKGHDVVAVELPVTFDGAISQVAGLLAGHHPAVFIATGVAGSAQAIRLETLAVNEINAKIPDNSGEQPIGVPVHDGAARTLPTTLPAAQIEQAWTLADIPHEFSDNAGRYVCNATFFALQNVASSSIKTGFIHIPSAAIVPIEISAQAIEIAAEIALLHSSKTKVLLRPWQGSDAAALLEARDTTPDLDKQFATDFVSEGDTARYISEYLQFNERVKNWAIVVDGAPVGNVGLSNISKSNESAWAFYWLAAAARGQGYASNALATVANWAFQNQIFRLELGHRTNNPASCRVATSAGFLVEGLERQGLKYGDERFDVELHSRLSTDPEPANTTIFPMAQAPEDPPKWEVARSAPMPDAVARLLDTVPEWFGHPESNAEYLNDSRSMETWAVRDNRGAVIGLVLTAQRFPQVLEIHLMVVDSAYHGQGIGTALIKAIEAEAKRDGARVLEVKTLAATHPDVHYARTRHFYEKMGFIPLEETNLWGEDTPCLIMVKPLA